MRLTSVDCARTGAVRLILRILSPALVPTPGSHVFTEDGGSIGRAADNTWELPDSKVPSHCAVARASYWLPEAATALRLSSRDWPLGTAAAQLAALEGSSGAHLPASEPAEDARFFSMPSGGEAMSVASWRVKRMCSSRSESDCR